MLHGRAIIDLHNTRTHRDERIVHDNMLTNWYRDVQKQASIYGGMTAPLGTFGRNTVFRGLIMFNSALTNDADDYLIPSPAVNAMIAHGDTSTYSGTDLTRGSFNSSQSTSSEGSITSVWDFTQEQGNGVISSLGLCRTIFGLVGNGGKNYDSVAANKALYTDYLSTYSPIGSSRIKYGDNVQVASFIDATNGHVVTMSIQSGSLVVKRNWSFFGVVNPLRGPLGTTPTFYQTEEPSAETYDLTTIFSTSSTCVGFVANDGKFWLMPSGNLADGATRTLVCFDILAKTYTTQTITNNTGATLYFPNPSTGGVGPSMVIDNGVLYCITTNYYAAYIDLSDNTDCGLVTAPSGSGNVSVAYYSPCVSLYKWGNLVIAGSEMLMINQNTSYIYALNKGESWYLQLRGFRTLTTGVGAAGAFGHNIGKWLTGTGGAVESANDNEAYANKLILAPALVTKNNLESAVTKTGDMTMRVTYTITDAAS